MHKLPHTVLSVHVCPAAFLVHSNSTRDFLALVILALSSSTWVSVCLIGGMENETAQSSNPITFFPMSPDLREVSGEDDHCGKGLAVSLKPNMADRPNLFRPNQSTSG